MCIAKAFHSAIKEGVIKFIFFICHIVKIGIAQTKCQTIQQKKTEIAKIKSNKRKKIKLNKKCNTIITKFKYLFDVCV